MLGTYQKLKLNLIILCINIYSSLCLYKVPLYHTYLNFTDYEYSSIALLLPTKLPINELYTTIKIKGYDKPLKMAIDTTWNRNFLFGDKISK